MIILEDESIDLVGNIVLLGRQDAQVKERLSAENLMKYIGKDKYVITISFMSKDDISNKEIKSFINID